MIFNIYNVPKDIDKILYLKNLIKLDLNHNDIFSLSNIREITKTFEYKIIIDLILDIGINCLSEKLIEILIERNIDIYQISNYLENNKDKKFIDKDFDHIAPYIIFNLTKNKNEKKMRKYKKFQMKIPIEKEIVYYAVIKIFQLVFIQIIIKKI